MGLSTVLFLSQTCSMVLCRVIPPAIPVCICTLEFSPVCGLDKVTYSNRCQAGCAKAEVKCEGECPCPNTDCFCTREMDPVCGEDGVVYSNQCLARCKGVTVECMGECPCPYSVTTPSSDPGLGYQDIANIFSYFEFTSDGSATDCNCPDKFPVCGVDGRTYSSRCEAECKGVEVECDGECVCVSKRSWRERMLVSMPKITYNLRVNLTSRAPNCYGQVTLLNSTTVALTHLNFSANHLKSHGPVQVNWIVGNKSRVGVDSNTYIIDKLTPTGEPLYSVLGHDVPSLPSYTGQSVLLTLPAVDQNQLTFEDISWLALYSRVMDEVFMDVKLPETFQLMD